MIQTSFERRGASRSLHLQIQSYIKNSLKLLISLLFLFCFFICVIESKPRLLKESAFTKKNTNLANQKRETLEIKALLELVCGLVFDNDKIIRIR